MGGDQEGLGTLNKKQSASVDLLIMRSSELRNPTAFSVHSSLEVRKRKFNLITPLARMEK